jgi:hypothetical protein
MINNFFNWCVYVLEVIGNVTGMGYELANIVIFVIIQPLLILIFFILWKKEKRKIIYPIKNLLNFEIYEKEYYFFCNYIFIIKI